MPIQASKKNKLIPIASSNTSASESYRMLRTNIQFLSSERKIQKIMVTSSMPGEGKSTTIANLAISFAQDNKKVILIDSDLRKPSLHHYFNISSRFGLSNILSTGQGIDDAILRTEIPTLFFLPSGMVPPNSTELLNSKRMETLLEELCEQFDVVLIDTPPALAIVDSRIVANLCDGVVVVVDSRKSKRNIVKQVIDGLKQSHAKILGVVLNYHTNPYDSAYQDYY